MKKALLTAGMMAILAAGPVCAQGQRPRGDRSQTIVQGTVQNVNGSILWLQLPNYPPQPGQQYGPPGPVMQIDISQAQYEAPDGTVMGPQGLAPGERVVILTHTEQSANQPYGNQYNPQYNQQNPGGMTIYARVIEPLDM